jgi:hypothetical protein
LNTSKSCIGAPNARSDEGRQRNRSHCSHSSIIGTRLGGPAGRYFEKNSATAVPERPRSPDRENERFPRKLSRGNLPLRRPSKLCAAVRQPKHIILGQLTRRKYPYAKLCGRQVSGAEWKYGYQNEFPPPPPSSKRHLMKKDRQQVGIARAN